MATVYDTPTFNDPAVADPRNGVTIAFVKYTVGSTAIAQSSGDYIRLVKLPKDVQLVPELCSLFADADPDSGNNLTVSVKVTDGTTTKTLISTSNFFAANSRITPSSTDICDLGFFRTSNDDFYVKVTPEAGDLDAAAVIFGQIAYSSNFSRDASTS